MENLKLEDIEVLKTKVSKASETLEKLTTLEKEILEEEILEELSLSLKELEAKLSNALKVLEQLKKEGTEVPIGDIAVASGWLSAKLSNSLKIVMELEKKLSSREKSKDNDKDFSIKAEVNKNMSTLSLVTENKKFNLLSL